MRRNLAFCSAFWVGLVALNPAEGVAQSPAPMTPQRILIEFGWDEPDTGFLRSQLSQIERTPFDGCVFHVASRSRSGQIEDLKWLAWGTRGFHRDEVAHAIADLRAMKPTRPRHDFLRFNTTPGRLDWFDDHAAILQNAQLVATIAREGGCRGILLDTEQYQGKLFRYDSQRDAATKPYEAYAAKAKQRGCEVMRALQRGYPGLTVVLTFGHSYAWDLMHRDPPKSLEQVNYGLLAPFVDGLIDAAEGTTRIIDGYERSYGFKTRAQFDDARKSMTVGVLPIVADPKKYQRVVRPGFGLWLDYDREKHPWNTGDTSKNYFTPDSFASSLALAFEHTDELVWIYSETPRWWTPRGGPEQLPRAYVDAIRRVR